jgi:hypothetical protein
VAGRVLGLVGSATLQAQPILATLGDLTAGDSVLPAGALTLQEGIIRHLIFFQLELIHLSIIHNCSYTHIVTCEGEIHWLDISHAGYRIGGKIGRSSNPPPASRRRSLPIKLFASRANALYESALVVRAGDVGNPGWPS